MVDIAGMAHLRDDAEMGAQKRAGQFGNQFLARIGLIAEALRQVATEARRMRRPMAEFVQRGAVVIGRADEIRTRRQADEILARMIEGLAATDADDCARGGNQSLGGAVFLVGGNGLGRGHDLGRQAVALLDVEDGEALQERYAPRFVIALACPVARLARHEAVGVTDGGAALALAHMTAQAPAPA